MNERIKELAEQAAEEKFGEVFGEMKLTMIFAEKFAELIVENCAQAAEEYWNDAGLQRTFSPSEYIYTILEVEE